MKKQPIIIAILIFLITLSFTEIAIAQTAPTFPKLEQKRFFTLTVENDSIGSGSDKNYTSGVRLSLLDTGATIPSFINNIAAFVPTVAINETTSLYYSLGHNLYTPDDITTRIQDPKDRPWAAFLYGSAGLASLTGNHVDELEITLGIIGPWAQGEKIQKTVHHITNSKQPKGWKNQLKNEPGLILSWQRRWPNFYYLEKNGYSISLDPHSGITLGNVYTYANGGFTVRFGPEAAWQDTPPRVRPAIPGTGYFAYPNKQPSWYIFAGMDGRAVAQNIFLDGNTFRNSHSVNKRHIVGDANAGLAMTYKQARVSYALNWRSKEFKGQDSTDLFGTISIGYRF